MYARSYTDDESTIHIPDGYDGTALIERFPDERCERAKNECAESNAKSSIPDMGDSASVFFGKDDDECEKTQHEGGAKGFFDKIFSSFLPIKSCSPKSIFEKIGLEELLIIGVALFLFFSKESDKECAIMLLVLLFIN